MPLQIKRIALNTPDYAKAVALREAVLRRPLGLTFSREELELDARREHLVALEGATVLGGVSFFLQEPTLLRIKQMAVDPLRQGRGIGKQLLHAAEQRGVAMGAEKALLHARGTAVEFYKRQGYKIVGEKFSEQGIPHVKMEKKLR